MIPRKTPLHGYKHELVSGEGDAILNIQGNGKVIELRQKWSTHTPITLCAILLGVLNQLPKLTSQTSNSQSIALTPSVRRDLHHQFSYYVIIMARSVLEKISWQRKWPGRWKKDKQEYLFLRCVLTLFLYVHPQGDKQDLKYFNLSWFRVQISYHRYNDLSKLIYEDFIAKIGQGILYLDLMDRECNCSNPSNITGKCFYKGRIWGECLIYEVKYPMCDAIYIGNTR